MIQFDHWHIEPSSICTLKCPRCPRVEVPDSLLNRQLTLDFFQNQIGEEVIKNIKKITFCGNDGDPIYCRELQEICQWVKRINPYMHLVIITNGSHKTQKWWQDLAKILDHHDEINWSIDGWDQSSNDQYRKNSQWHSIIAGIRAFAAVNTSTYRVWATIAFRFNQSHLHAIKNLAMDLAMDAWQLTKSTKFGSHYPQAYGTNDPLCPDDPDLISSTHRFQRLFDKLTDRERPGASLQQIFWQRAQDLSEQKQYSSICMIGNKGVFLNSRGEFYPCCWTANRYDHNSKWHDLAQSRFNLHRATFSDIIQDKFWTADFLRFDSLECRTKCTVEKLKDKEYVTEW